MMDWRGNGSDTARTWALQMTIDILGNEEKKVFPSNVSSSSSSSSWPLPSVVYSIGFELTSSVLKSVCFASFDTQNIFLPRQARDKHGNS